MLSFSSNLSFGGRDHLLKSPRRGKIPLKVCRKCVHPGPSFLHLLHINPCRTRAALHVTSAQWKKGADKPWERGGAMTRLIKPKAYSSIHNQGDAPRSWQIAPTSEVFSLIHTHAHSLHTKRAWTQLDSGVFGFLRGSRFPFHKEPNLVWINA